MRPGSQFLLRAAARMHTPLLALFALSLFASRPPGGGVGFLAGLAFALILVLHVLVFGAAAARRAMPAAAGSAVLVLGLLAALVGVGLPGLAYSAQIVEGGLFLLTVGAASLAMTVLVGRAPTMREEDI